MKRRISKAILVMGLLLTVTGLVQAQGGGVPESAMLGGALTVFDASEEAFANAIPGLSPTELALHDEGDEGFEREFDETQVGPFFDAISCEDCHEGDGRGQPPQTSLVAAPVSDTVSETADDRSGRGRGGDSDSGRPGRPGPGRGEDGRPEGDRPRPPRDSRDADRTESATSSFSADPLSVDNPGFVVMLSLPQRDLFDYMPDPIYGGQFQAHAIPGVAAEGVFVIEYTEINGTFSDGTPYSLRRPVYRFDDLAYGTMSPDFTFSPRVANQVFGLGLLEAVPEDVILALADPSDSDGDGISGRPNYIWDFHNNTTALGRFGWKANNPTLLQQTAGAYFNDMGLTNSVFSHISCTNSPVVCGNSPDGLTPEISDEELLAVVFYTQTLAVPVQRNYNDPEVQYGAEVFEAAGCSSCHTSTLTTGIHPTVPALSNQVFHPYTDLLLHDMGDDLADGRPQGLATGSEWRTPPLWGIGLFDTVNGHTTYLHDGRARNLTEAILWHGGEGQASRDFFLNLSASDRAALTAFLKSL